MNINQLVGLGVRLFKLIIIGYGVSPRTEIGECELQMYVKDMKTLISWKTEIRVMHWRR